MKASKSPYEIASTPPKQESCVEIRFLLSQSICGYIIGRNGFFTKKLKSDLDVQLDIRYSSNQDSVAILIGEISKVQDGIILLFKKINEYETGNPSQAQHIKLLLPPNALSRVMEDNASILKTIASKSNGAKLKLVQDEQGDSIVEIRGGMSQKQDAACILLGLLLELFELGIDQEQTQIVKKPSVSRQPSPTKFDGRIEANGGNDKYISQDVSGRRQHLKTFTGKDYGQSSNFGYKDNIRKDFRSSRNSFNPRERSPAPHRDSRDKRHRYRSRSRSAARDHRTHLIQQESTASFTDRDGNSIISLNCVVPNNQVAMIIGKRGDVVKQMMSKSECNISFYREVTAYIGGMSEFSDESRNSWQVLQSQRISKGLRKRFEIIV